jgi:hypothetical protein
MFNRAIRGQRWLPKYLSFDHDPLYKSHQWHANLRIVEVTEIKTVPYVPLSHPFVERLIGTIRRECLDHVLFWTSADLENKPLDFRTYLTTIAPITRGKGEPRIYACHDPSPICARFVGDLTVKAYTRHPWLPEFSKICASSDMQVSVGKNSK